jgi:phosphoribosylformylglycinamidine cyclo-ligase
VAISYKQSGVDIDRGDALVEWLKTLGPGPHQQQIVSGIGGFAALFKTNFASMKEPALVSCTDGVGTKLKLAAHFQTYAGIGQDLVGMNVNDLICCGAQPLFFLDYYSTGSLDLTVAKEFLKGVRQACDRSDLALIGGETAEMPGMYHGKDFDCAGFCVGVVDMAEALGPQRVQRGAKLLGVSSSGFHSNGYSLLRQVFAGDLDEHRAVLMEPTALYVGLAKALRELKVVQAFAHITGGGIWNLLRVIPENLAAEVRPWPIPEAFLEVRRRAELPWSEMLKTLNCGVGFVAVIDPEGFQAAKDCTQAAGFKAFDLGEVVEKRQENRLMFNGKQFDD